MSHISSYSWYCMTIRNVNKSVQVFRNLLCSQSGGVGLAGVHYQYPSHRLFNELSANSNATLGRFMRPEPWSKIKMWSRCVCVGVREVLLCRTSWRHGGLVPVNQIHKWDFDESWPSVCGFLHTKWHVEHTHKPCFQKLLCSFDHKQQRWQGEKLNLESFMWVTRLEAEPEDEEMRSSSSPSRWASQVTSQRAERRQEKWKKKVLHWLIHLHCQWISRTFSRCGTKHTAMRCTCEESVSLYDVSVLPGAAGISSYCERIWRHLGGEASTPPQLKSWQTNMQMNQKETLWLNH